jgi:hypothetical protein
LRGRHGLQALLIIPTLASRYRPRSLPSARRPDPLRPAPRRRERRRPFAVWLSRLLSSCAPRLHLFSGAELAQLSWGLAALRQPLAERQLEALLNAVMERKSEGRRRGRAPVLGWAEMPRGPI